MNESSPSPTPSSPTSTATPARRRWRGWKLAGLGAAIAGVLSLAACHPGGPGWHHGHRGHHGAHAQMSPEQAAKRIDKAVNWVLDDVDATAEQKSRVAGLAKEAAGELMPLRAQHHAARGQAIGLLTADSIDRAALEQVRADELRLAEQASRRVTQALADIAEVLTPAQRRQLAEQFRKRWS